MGCVLRQGGALFQRRLGLCLHDVATHHLVHKRVWPRRDQKECSRPVPFHIISRVLGQHTMSQPGSTILELQKSGLQHTPNEKAAFCPGTLGYRSNKDATQKRDACTGPCPGVVFHAF